MSEPREWFTPAGGDPLTGVPAIVPLGWCEDDGCVVCGSPVDTGLECVRCGADHMPAANRKEQ